MISVKTEIKADRFPQSTEKPDLRPIRHAFDSTIQDFESICLDVNRRSLQRDLKGMLDKQLISSE